MRTAALLLLVSCSSSEPSTTSVAAAADLGKLCADPIKGTGCGGGLVCMDADPIGGFVCTKRCNSSADCPGNGHCYIFDGGDGHICALRCASHDECSSLKPGTFCRGRGEPQVMICVDR